MTKRRLIHFIIFLLIIPLGYSTRKFPFFYPAFIAEYGGDTIWAGMFVFLFRSIWPRSELWKIVLGSYLLTVAIEVSELYHAPWIDNIRHTFLGKMLLGWGFLWSDLICYLCGILIAWGIATFVDRCTSK